MKSDGRAFVERCFLNGVIGFLAISVYLKLLGITGGQRFWASRDPVMPILTLRQITIAAGLLELSVVLCLVLVRKRAWRLSVILWLVTLFAVYRAGLAATGYHGPCTCFGSLPWVVPSSRQWIDWVSPLSLLVMGGGSGWLMWGGNRRPKRVSS